MEGKNSSIPLDEFEKQSIEDTERHFIGNILLDQETEEFGHEWPEKGEILFHLSFPILVFFLHQMSLKKLAMKTIGKVV